jgi:hypothetical protein
MEEKLREIPCPACKKPLGGAGISGTWSKCFHCRKLLHINASAQEAINIATLNEAWIERIWWKESNSKVVGYLIDIPLVLSIVIIPAAVFACWDWRFLLAVTPYIVLRVSRWAIARMFPNLFAWMPYFIVSSRGVIIVASYPEPLFLPWSSIVRYSWSSQVGSMTSWMTIEYAAAANQVATVVLEGEEKHQPLGELVDILEGRQNGNGSEQPGT